MSSTTVETAANSFGVPEAMARPYTPAWAPDSRQPPRDPGHHHPQIYNQPPQSIRLPPPESLVSGAPGSRGPSHLQSSQYPRLAPLYQGPDVPTSTPHASRPPPPPGLPSHHGSAIVVDQQRHHGLHPAQTPPILSPPPSSNPPTFQSQRILHPAREQATPGPQPALPTRPPAVDTRGDQRPDIQPAPPAATAKVLAPAVSSPPVSPSSSKPRHMSIPNLLSDDGKRSAIVNRRASGLDAEYNLEIRQQPVAARSCGFGERDRRVIDPPPIVQLTINSIYLSKAEINARLKYPHYIMTCSIYDDSGTQDAAFMPEEYRQQRRLMGSLVGAPFVGKDEFGKEGCFFCFPDLSCRTPGAFRLKFSLVMIDPSRASDVVHFPVLIETTTNVFTVFSAKDFPGMQASTKLTKRLKEQGCIISIKKGNDRSKNSRIHDDLSDQEQDEGGPSSYGKRQRLSGQQ
ncbi:velvet factor-domain-containing protein [Ilyonectria robusta]|uniref:velvet factor-domain-containing protein n=1 Tax=Ilyonectria robusta TaxID=1079257 RepID=UPI001E8CD144|nr:velvet factor-domain-containing protein [Ilyonectria robusta]KAH8737780.1 velvet factor-domain-containing protein [Ilyonectria robusta]